MAGNTTSSKQFLVQTGTGTISAAPQWGSLASGDVTTALGFTPYNSTNPDGYTSNTGTVTSVGLSLPSFITVSNSPVTTTGTLTGALATQTANTVFAGPTTGAAAAPTFRSLVAADIPTLNQNTTGTAAGLSATLAIGSGGTGQTTATAAFNALAPSQTGNSGKYLTTDGTNASWAASTGIPTGALFPYAGATAPTGYLLCDGSSISSTNYLALHAVLSNTYGGSAYTGASGLSFNLPDLRGRLPMGAGTGITNFSTTTILGIALIGILIIYKVRQ